MPEMDESRRGSYRCPVCGHRDLAELAEGEAVGVIRCSHCDTRLRAELRTDDTGRFTVQVAEKPET